MAGTGTRAAGTGDGRDEALSGPGVPAPLVAAGRAARRAVPPPLRGPARSAAREVLGAWRRSIQLRVVSATVVLGVLVVLAVGQFLLARITSQIVASRQEAVIAQSHEDFIGTRTAIVSKSGEANQNTYTRVHDIVNG